MSLRKIEQPENFRAISPGLRETVLDYPKFRPLPRQPSRTILVKVEISFSKNIYYLWERIFDRRDHIITSSRSKSKKLRKGIILNSCRCSFMAKEYSKKLSPNEGRLEGEGGPKVWKKDDRQVYEVSKEPITRWNINEVAPSRD